MARRPPSFPSWGALALSSTAPSRTLSVLLLLISCASLLANISASSHDGHEAAEASSMSSLPLIRHLSPLDHVSTYGCLESERTALLQFKAGLDDPDGRLSSWRGLDCCRWAGVACNNLTGSVIKVDLRDASLIAPSWPSSDNLSGRIDSLLQLKSLRHLDLSGNSFYRVPIPEFIGSSKKLRYLNLSHSGFVGTLPLQLENLSCLRYLDLSSSYDADEAGLLRVDSLQWVSGLSSLKYLALDRVNLSTVEYDWVHLLNERLSLLTELHLQDCSLASIPPSLPYVNFTSLEVLDLSSNHFASPIPSWLPNISSLVYIDMSNCWFQGHVPVGFSELSYLLHLNLDDNHYLTSNVSELLGAGGYQRINTLRIQNSMLYGEIPSSIGNITSLACLLLTFNYIGGVIPSSIGKLRHLTKLDLQYNNIMGELPLAVGQLSELTDFDVSYNQLTGIVSEAHFSSLSKLKTLGLSNNSLILNVSSDWIPPFQLSYLSVSSCRLGPAFPSWTKSQRELVHIDLSKNGILDELSTWFWYLSSKHNLELLYLSDNNFGGGIPTSIGKLHNLQLLELSSSNLTGGIPTSIGKLRGLSSLDLSGNNLTGGIPPSIGDMESLWDLNLRNNSLTGGIPTSIRKLRKLQSVDLSENKLTGDIPSFIGEMDSLKSLRLSDNKLTGGIPTSLGKLQGLMDIDLSVNNLTGGIPTSIGDMYTLSALFLSNNNLTGGIPTSIGKLQELLALGLSENKLAGGIPTTLFNCSSLEILNLRGNNLSGDIPTSPFKLMKDLKILDLSGNMFSGKFPSFIRNLSGLETLDLASNNFHGDIPTWIESIQDVRILRLRSNRFSGEIPSQLSNLKLLRVLDVAKNNLTGPIPEQLGHLDSMLPAGLLRSFSRKDIAYIQNLIVHTKGSNLPYAIQRSFFITVIDLSENRLSGKFPESLINLSGLIVLDLSRNFLTGIIPEKIENMRELQSLDLSDNHFIGRIPPSMTSMSFLSFLNLSYNNFSGEIPVGGQLDTFNDESFLGNPYLCGPLHQRKCQKR